MANEQMRTNWDTGSAGWVEHRELFESELGPFGAALVERLEGGAHDRVLDIGCGTGGLLERFLDRGATGVGVDIATAMIDGAVRAVPGGEFVVADAQTDDLATLGPFTRVVSRFGVMFFDDPTAAFANIRTAAAPGAQLGFVCWRSGEENAMFTLGTRTLLAALDEKPEPPAPGAPGPLAFADPGRIRAVLEGSGWADVGIEKLDLVCDYGRDGSDGIENRLRLVLNISGGRAAAAQLRQQLDAEGWAALLDEVRDELRSHLVDGRVQFNGATWLVTARNPG